MTEHHLTTSSCTAMTRRSTTPRDRELPPWGVRRLASIDGLPAAAARYEA
jgi:hypothetical protein